MRSCPVLLAAALGVACVSALAACGEQLAQPARDHRSVETASVAAQSAAPAVQRAAPPTSSAATRQIAGRPMWADSRRYTAEENAAYQFGQHAAELEAGDLDDFLAKAHRFVNDPPAGAKTLVRANGDRLLYDPGSGLFGVARRDGAPRTVFKPSEGEAYWAQQVRENQTRTATAGGGEG